jgi:hypothetical protein
MFSIFVLNYLSFSIKVLVLGITEKIILPILSTKPSQEFPNANIITTY